MMKTKVQSAKEKKRKKKVVQSKRVHHRPALLARRALLSVT